MSKRKKTVSARLDNGVLAVYAPAGIPDKELQPIICPVQGKAPQEKNQKGFGPEKGPEGNSGKPQQKLFWRAITDHGHRIFDQPELAVRLL